MHSGSSLICGIVLLHVMMQGYFHTIILSIGHSNQLTTAVTCFADIYGWWLTLIPKVCCWLKMFVVPWWLCELHDSVWVGCRRRPEHWVGTQLNIGSVSLSNTKRLLTGCLHSFMRGVGFTNVYIFCMCSFACSGFGVIYPPILVGYGHSSVDCKLKHRCAVSCGHVQQ